MLCTAMAAAIRTPSLLAIPECDTRADTLGEGMDGHNPDDGNAVGAAAPRTPPS